jgi:uncharacterized protein involved in exopolysaccharide biosynthesis
MPKELRFVPKSMPVASPTARDIAAILFRQHRLWLATFCTIFLGVLVYGLICPPYQSEMKVLVRRGRMDPLATSIPSSSPQFANEEVTEEELNSEAELLHDDQILTTVARQTGAAGDRSWWGKLTGESEDAYVARVARRLNQRLSVEPVRKTALIDVTYNSSDAERGAKILKCLGKVYLERHLKVHRPSGEFNFFDHQLVEARQQLERSEEQLLAFTRDEGVVSAAYQRDIALQKMSDVDGSQNDLRVSLAATAERVKALQGKLPTIPERTTTQIRNLDNPQLLEKLKSRLLDLELKRTELLTKYGASYRLVQEVNQEIEQSKAAIVAEDKAPLRDQASDQDPDHEWVKSELIKAQIQLQDLLARSSATAAVFASYRNAAQELGERAIQQQELQNDLKAAEDKYLLYAGKREEARIGDALDQGGILNVTIAEQPVVPPLPTHSAFFFGCIGLVAAATSGTGIAFAADRLNPAFRTPDEVMAHMGTPVLASLPRGRGWSLHS